VATIDDIAKVSGVSRSTVFRFLNGSNVRLDARKAIIQAMEQLDYKTDAVYKQQNIVIEISTSNEFESFKGFAEMVQGITRQADEKGIRVHIVRRTGEQITSDYSHWNTEENFKGVIVIGKNIEDEQKEAEMLVARGIPHIFLNRVMDHPAVSYVAVDLKKAAYDVVCYLINKGHKDIAICGNPHEFRVDKDKLEGYKKALLGNDIKVSEKYYCELKDIKGWDGFFETLLIKENQPTAFFGICDSHAMQFINKAQAAGYRVPEDIAVVGMDDVETSEYFKPALTTVHVPFRKMGMTAVESLLQMITDEDVSCIKTIIKHHLIIRESCNKCIELS
jgi:DNA-binding LacI/PurR family transcriptional regulator